MVALPRRIPVSTPRRLQGSHPQRLVGTALADYLLVKSPQTRTVPPPWLVALVVVEVRLYSTMEVSFSIPHRPDFSQQIFRLNRERLPGRIFLIGAGTG